MQWGPQTPSKTYYAQLTHKPRSKPPAPTSNPGKHTDASCNSLTGAAWDMQDGDSGLVDHKRQNTTTRRREGSPRPTSPQPQGEARPPTRPSIKACTLGTRRLPHRPTVPSGTGPGLSLRTARPGNGAEGEVHEAGLPCSGDSGTLQRPSPPHRGPFNSHR